MAPPNRAQYSIWQLSEEGQLLVTHAFRSPPGEALHRQPLLHVRVPDVTGVICGSRRSAMLCREGAVICYRQQGTYPSISCPAADNSAAALFEHKAAGVWLHNAIRTTTLSHHQHEIQ